MIHAGNPVSLLHIIFIFALFWEQSWICFCIQFRLFRLELQEECALKVFACRCRSAFVSVFALPLSPDHFEVPSHCRERTECGGCALQGAQRMTAQWCNPVLMPVERLWNRMGWNKWPRFSFGGCEMRQAGLGRTGTLIGLYVWLHSWAALTLGSNAGRHCPTNRVIATNLQK